uniref:Uncharacterized protein n=1 Tax=Solanum tuberosum TaxID=4113 RepID=M1DA60_SOLTU
MASPVKNLLGDGNGSWQTPKRIINLDPNRLKSENLEDTETRQTGDGMQHRACHRLELRAFETWNDEFSIGFLNYVDLKHYRDLGTII